MHPKRLGKLIESLFLSYTPTCSDMLLSIALSRPNKRVGVSKSYKHVGAYCMRCEQISSEWAWLVLAYGSNQSCLIIWQANHLPTWAVFQNLLPKVLKIYNAYNVNYRFSVFVANFKRSPRERLYYYGQYKRSLTRSLVAFSRKSSFATVVKFFNMIGLALSFSLDLNV